MRDDDAAIDTVKAVACANLRDKCLLNATCRQPII